MTEHKLMPCPFCGKPGEMMFDPGVPSGKRHYSVGCRDVECDAFLLCRAAATAEDNIIAWNTRAPAAELPGWEEMVEAAAKALARDHGDDPDEYGFLITLWNERAVIALTAARVPELLARVQRLEALLLDDLTEEAQRLGMYALENKP